MTSYASRLFLLSATLMAASSHAALALEADEFGHRLIEISKFMGAPITYESARAEGEVVTLSNFTIQVPGEDPLELPGELVFEGVLETPEGGYTATRASIADIAFEDADEGMALSLVDVYAEGIALPASVSMDTMLATATDLYRRISAGPFTIADLEGNTLFSIEAFEATNTGAAEDGGVTTTYQVSGIVADLSQVDEPEVQEAVGALDVAQLHASMGGSGTWWPQTGRVVIEDSFIEVEDLGAISMTLAADGYTEDFYAELLKTNVKLSEMIEAGIDIDTTQLDDMSQAMLESMDGISLSNLSMRYDDQSLFMKILDFAGAEQGVDGEAMKAGLQFMVSMGLAEVEHEGFRAMVNEAVTEFLSDPQNLLVSLEPSQPIAFAQLIDMADAIETDPFQLIDLLGIRIEANEE